MEHAIQEIEQLCQEKLLLFQEILAIFQNEKKSIIGADIGSLWIHTRKKQEIADKIHEIRDRIMAIALDAEILVQEDTRAYSLLKIISALPNSEKSTLVHVRFALNGVKNMITALAHENRKYLEESMKTVEDLVQIIIRNSNRDERYGRDRYMRHSLAKRPNLILGEV
ncbi:MAG: flagellar protein FlgN [Proteobacteria bacterium]|nr:flagellar protein FlgN [Pseudomonadota bacterium]